MGQRSGRKRAGVRGDALRSEKETANRREWSHKKEKEKENKKTEDKREKGTLAKD